MECCKFNNFNIIFSYNSFNTWIKIEIVKLKTGYGLCDVMLKLFMQ